MSPEEWDATPWYLQRCYLDGLMEERKGADQSESSSYDEGQPPQPNQRDLGPQVVSVDQMSQRTAEVSVWSMPE